MLKLIQTKRTDERLLLRMKNHYSEPKGFVGRNICYAIYYDSLYYGHIVAGSATRFLPNRNKFFGIKLEHLNHVVNNIFYNASPAKDKYPIRNFTTKVLKLFVDMVNVDWPLKYGNNVVGFESLVEKPRTGELYKRAGWVKIGETIGYSCKRGRGKGTDSWTGKRIWNTEQLRPKFVFCFINKRHGIHYFKALKALKYFENNG